MKYKQIPFNMTLAKHITDGSVCGRVYAMHHGCKREVITYVEQLDNGNEVFEVELPSPFNTEQVDFTPNGQSIHKFNGYYLLLFIEIPVEDSYDNDYCNANSGVKEKQEAKKDEHYHKLKIEPIEYILANNLGFCEGNIVKYISRYQDKGGVDDLRKIKIYVDYLIDELTKED